MKEFCFRKTLFILNIIEKMNILNRKKITTFALQNKKQNGKIIK